MATVKHLPGHRNHRYELVDEPNKQPNKIFIGKVSAIKVIMDCRTTTAHKFRTRLRVK